MAFSDWKAMIDSDQSAQFAEALAIAMRQWNDQFEKMFKVNYDFGEKVKLGKQQDKKFPSRKIVGTLTKPEPETKLDLPLEKFKMNWKHDITQYGADIEKGEKNGWIKPGVYQEETDYSTIPTGLVKQHEVGKLTFPNRPVFPMGMSLADAISTHEDFRWGGSGTKVVYTQEVFAILQRIMDMRNKKFLRTTPAVIIDANEVLLNFRDTCKPRKRSQLDADKMAWLNLGIFILAQIECKMDLVPDKFDPFAEVDVDLSKIYFEKSFTPCKGVSD